MVRLERAKTQDIDKGLRKLLKTMRKLDDTFVDAGIFEGEGGSSDSSITVAQLGTIHEFGTSDGRIPERSWMRSTDSENRNKYSKMMDAVFDRVLRGKGQIASRLTAVGERIASDLRRKITSLRTPPNAASTIAQKGSSNPLIDTGHMRQSVRSRINIGGR